MIKGFMNFLPKSLLIALGVQLCSQFIKFVTYSIQHKKLSFKYLVTFGGMPSAHSAFVTALAASIGIFAGTNSELFALAAVFGGIVIFDAYKLRGNVQKQAILVNKMQVKVLDENQRIKLNEMVGHSLPEIVAGIIMALILAIPAAMILKTL